MTRYCPSVPERCRSMRGPVVRARGAEHASGPPSAKPPRRSSCIGLLSNSAFFAQKAMSKVMQRSTARVVSRTRLKAAAYSGRQRKTRSQSSASTRCFRTAVTVVRLAKQRPNGVRPVSPALTRASSRPRPRSAAHQTAWLAPRPLTRPHQAAPMPTPPQPRPSTRPDGDGTDRPRPRPGRTRPPHATQSRATDGYIRSSPPAPPTSDHRGARSRPPRGY
jgi:hypothetical protein